MTVTITTTRDEHIAVLKAIDRLNNAPYIKSMSQAMIATEACVKPTKVRVILQSLLDEGLINQYELSGSRRIKRYYYTLVNMREV